MSDLHRNNKAEIMIIAQETRKRLLDSEAHEDQREYDHRDPNEIVVDILSYSPQQ